MRFGCNRCRDPSWSQRDDQVELTISNPRLHTPVGSLFYTSVRRQTAVKRTIETDSPVFQVQNSHPDYLSAGNLTSKAYGFLVDPCLGFERASEMIHISSVEERRIRASFGGAVAWKFETGVRSRNEKRDLRRNSVQRVVIARSRPPAIEPLGTISVRDYAVVFNVYC